MMRWHIERETIMKLILELCNPELLLRFLDRIEPGSTFLIPEDVVRIADALEMRLVERHQ